MILKLLEKEGDLYSVGFINDQYPIESSDKHEEKVLSLIDFAVKKIGLKSTGIQLTSMDGYKEIFVINESSAEVVSDNWDTYISSKDEKLINRIKQIIDNILLEQKKE